MTVALALLLAGPALGIDRETVLDIAAEFCTHEWTMGSDNQYGSCSSDHVSDYDPGTTYRGIPYDWGGWVTTAEYDEALADGYGAGSHSWHGVLWCTVGVDCSGFVSQAWETDHKHGTATFYQVTHEISTGSLMRGDALNRESSHIVLFAYETAAGIPVHIESAGELVITDVDQGWSAFSSYSAIRYDDISDGSETGTLDQPIEITRFPYEDLRWTAGAASDEFDTYSCSDADESGPEQIYHLQVATAGTLDLRVTCDNSVDVDIHVLDGPSSDDCLARADTDLSVYLEPGEHWIVADSYVGSYEYAGPYILTASFTGTLGEAPDDDPPDTGGVTVQDTGVPDTEDGEPDQSHQALSRSAVPPGDLVAMDEMGCGCAARPSDGIGLAVLLGLLAPLGLRRRRA